MPEPSCHACGGPIAIGEPVTLYHPPCDALLTDALLNARADVAHGMAELARVTAGRDALAAEVRTLTRDLMRAIDERDEVIEAGRAVVGLIVEGVRRIHLIADSGSTWADQGRGQVRTIARTIITGYDERERPT